MQDLFIYIIGILSVITGIGVVVSKKSLNSALFLVATMCLIAAQFGMMRADLLATLQILVYAGAIMILVVFVIMLLGVERDAEKVAVGMPASVGIAFSLLFVAFMVTILSQASFASLTSPRYQAMKSVIESSEEESTGEEHGQEQGEEISEAAQIGALLVKEHIVAFQAIGVLLLGAILAAAMLGFSEVKPLMPGRGLRAVREKFNEVEPEEV